MDTGDLKKAVKKTLGNHSYDVIELQDLNEHESNLVTNIFRAAHRVKKIATLHEGAVERYTVNI